MKKIEELNLNLTKKQVETFNRYIELFLETNSKINLISKNDEKVFIEKHIFDSLSITKFLEPNSYKTLLDIGTGGGLPAIPLAIFYPNLKIWAIDSIRKKINVVSNFKEELHLDNLTLICDRVENFDMKFDYVVSRAVASLDKILDYAVSKLKKNGTFIAYKSKKYDQELDEAANTIKRYGIGYPKVLSYNLPLKEHFERNLLIFEL